MDRLKGKVVFLTGGGGVLGRASALLFAQEGARIAVIDIARDKAAETAQRITANGGEAIALHVDITDETDVREAVETTVKHWGHLDTLFNNAAIMPHNALCPGPIETEHVRQFFAGEAARKLRLDRIPLGRFGRPDDVAEVALFLASDAASWLTGQAIVLDGGISCNYFTLP